MMRRIAILVMLIALIEIPIVAYAQTDTPTPPTPTSTPFVFVPDDQMYDAMQQANEQLGDANGSLTIGTDQRRLLPQVDWSALFGYVKWITSEEGSSELAGPFSPIYVALGLYLIAYFALNGLYWLIWAIIWLIKFVVWIFNTLFRVVGAVADVGKAVVSFVLAGLGI